MQIQALQTLVTEAVEAAGYSWEGQELSGADGRGPSMLRVFIDKEGGVTADDCGIAARQLRSALRVAGLQDDYRLELSSPGLDKRLFTPEQMQRYLDAQVNVRLHSAIEGRRKWIGALVHADEQVIRIITEESDEPLEFPLGEVHVIRLVPQI